MSRYARTNVAVCRFRHSRHSSGFTLIELTIVLAVAAVIAAFAVPSYRRQIARGHRLGAVTALYRVAHDFAARGTFDPLDEVTVLGNVPEQGVPVYRLSVRAAVESGGYVLSAVPVDDGPMRDDRCGIYQLQADGARRNRLPGSADTGEPPPGCWVMR